MSPYISAELFHALAGNDGTEMDKSRFTLGTSYAMGKRDVDVFYRLELPIADTTDLTVHIIGVGYSFAL